MSKGPRVLVVSPHTFEQFTGPGISNVNLFRGWPSAHLGSVFSDPLVPDTTVCGAFHRITEADFDYAPPVSWLRDAYRFRIGRSCRRSGRGMTPGAAASAATPTAGLRKPARALLARLGVYDLKCRVALSAPLIELVERLAPDVIYTMLGSLAWVRLVTALADRQKVPIVVHTTDDWPDVVHQGILSRPLRGTMDRELRVLLERATLRYGICDEMCRAYQARYGLAFEPLISPIESERWLPFAREEWSVRGTFRVVYLGTAQPEGRAASLAEVATAVSKLRGEGLDIAFEIHTVAEYLDDMRRRVVGFGGVSVLAGPPSSEAPALLGGADLLVITSDFDADAVRWLKYSLPAKAFAYMISSVPILVYAPKGMPPVEYARRERWGAVVDTQSAELLMATLRSLVTDPAVRERYGRRAREVALANHDARVVRARFRDALARVVGAPGQPHLLRAGERTPSRAR